MFFLLLGLSGCLSNFPGLLFMGIEALHECLWGVPYINKCDAWIAKKCLTTQQYSAFIAKEQANQKAFLDRYRRRSRWMWPYASLSTEQCARLGLMFKLPGSGRNHFFWVDPNVYEVGAPLFLGSAGGYFVEDKFFRLSLGVGYRYLMNPQIRLGIYGYYDYTTRNNILLNKPFPYRLDSQVLKNLHIFSAGIEIFTPLGRLIGNIYGNSTLATHKGDIKYAIDRGNFTFAIGAYYDQINVKGVAHVTGKRNYFPKYLRSFPINFGMSCRGGALEWKYKSNGRIYGVKYTYDNRSKHRLSWTMQWELLYRFALKYGSQRSSYMAPTERYLASSQNNEIGRQSFQRDALDRIRTEHMAITQAPKIRYFRNIFVEKYGNICALQAIEKDTLATLKTVPKLKDTAVLLEGSSRRVLGDVYSAYRDITIKDKDFEDTFTKGNQLQKLYLARSILHNISWVELLNRQGLVSIGVSEDDRAFNPSQKQLATINEFAATTNYFTPDQSKVLKDWRTDGHGGSHSTSIESMKHGYFKTGYAGIEYRMDAIGHRLVLLEKIAREVLPYYKSSNINLSQTKIISMQATLNEAITSNLHWQCTAALCSDFSQYQRKALFYLAHLPLPFEIKEQILQYAINNFIDLSAFLKHAKSLPQDLQLSKESQLSYGSRLDLSLILSRIQLITQDLQRPRLNESAFSYGSRLYHCCIKRLLIYLSSIQTGKDYWHLLAIPENPYGILF